MEVIKTIFEICQSIYMIPFNLFGYELTLGAVAIALGLMFILLYFIYGFVS